jgi:thiosulfate/3-mercaptopyruvate sulfurtransferase
MTCYPTLISPEQLQALSIGAEPWMVFDCSFELMQPQAGDLQYLESHITGAVRADLDRHLSAPKGAVDAASGGRHPLPSRAAFANWLGSLGFDRTMQAVVYDRQGAVYAGRLWWMLKWLGHEAVAVLDGGLQAWLAHGGPVSSGPDLAARAPTRFAPTGALAQLSTTKQVEQQLGRPTQTLLDARGEQRFRGEVEPLDPIAGHIPGALNRPFGNNFGTDGKFKPAATLRQEFDALLAGRDPAGVVHHCGSGVSAIPNLIAMELAGLGRGALYAGSWSDWCSDPRRPMAQG